MRQRIVVGRGHLPGALGGGDLKVVRPRNGGVDRTPEDALEDTLARLLATARETVRATHAALAILDASRTLLAHHLTDDAHDRTRGAPGARMHQRSARGHLLLDPRVVRLHEVVRCERSRTPAWGDPAAHSFLGVPVMIGGEPSGNLYFTDKQGAAFDETDEQTALATAERVARTVEDSRGPSDDPRVRP